MRYRPCFVCSFLLLASVAPTQAAAQAGLREGVKIRVVAPGAPQATGVVQAVTPDSIFLFAEPTGARLGIARSSITKLHVSEGKSAGRGALKGLVWGTGIMGVAGGIIALTLGQDENFETAYGDGQSPGEVFIDGLVGGAMLGAGIGAFVKSEKWTQVSVQPVISMETAGVRVSFSFR